MCDASELYAVFPANDSADRDCSVLLFRLERPCVIKWARSCELVKFFAVTVARTRLVEVVPLVERDKIMTVNTLHSTGSCL